MRDVISRFDLFYAEFRKTELWKSMLTVRENTPEHREENVAHHTRLVIDWYLTNLAHSRSDAQVMLTSMACLFHDVGKPLARSVATIGAVERTAPEILSLMTWFNYCGANAGIIRDHLRLSSQDRSRVSFIIANHGLSNLESERAAELPTYMDGAATQAWLDTIRSNQHGRYSDAHSQQLDRLYAALAQWRSAQR
jgi:hypothetical protein